MSADSTKAAGPYTAKLHKGSPDFWTIEGPSAPSDLSERYEDIATECRRLNIAFAAGASVKQEAPTIPNREEVIREALERSAALLHAVTGSRLSGYRLERVNGMGWHEARGKVGIDHAISLLAQPESILPDQPSGVVLTEEKIKTIAKAWQEKHRPSGWNDECVADRSRAESVLRFALLHLSPAKVDVDELMEVVRDWTQKRLYHSGLAIAQLPALRSRFALLLNQGQEGLPSKPTPSNPT
jgi:hypothetical protein